MAFRPGILSFRATVTPRASPCTRSRTVIGHRGLDAILHGGKDGGTPFNRAYSKSCRTSRSRCRGLPSATKYCAKVDTDSARCFSTVGCNSHAYLQNQCLATSLWKSAGRCPPSHQILGVSGHYRTFGRLQAASRGSVRASFTAMAAMCRTTISNYVIEVRILNVSSRTKKSRR